MAIELTEDDICQYVEEDVEEGINNTIVFESDGKNRDQIKDEFIASRTVSSATNISNEDLQMQQTLNRIEKELLSLKLNQNKKHNEEYSKVQALYKRVSKAYESGKDSQSVTSSSDDEITHHHDSIDVNFLDIQRMTQLEQKVASLEEAIGFNTQEDISNDAQNDKNKGSIVMRINTLYRHLKLIKNIVDDNNKSTSPDNLKMIATSQDKELTVQSFKHLSTYSPYINHIITRLENYSSVYGDVLDNNSRVRQWDDKIDTLIRQQDKWLELLDKLDTKLDDMFIQNN